MSKKAKAKLKKLRSAKKRARKAAQRAKYEAWKLAGVNTKSKRVELRGRRGRKVRNRLHPDGPCGNVGCRKCNPAPYNLLTPTFYAIQ